ncbi:MAG: hypothetical protein PHN84_01700 [Desulfuromonadaceae bacterium]|nr:hypothetical protein [Desulfuromonadaceae bacterium]MDD2854929.1 hypothetical protein [Desulfuromonadaceae bacterium]
MTSLIIDIRETIVRAIVSQDGVPGYHRTFEHAGSAKASSENTEAVTGLPLQEILKTIRKECGSSIDAAYLILPQDDVVISYHTTPKLSKIDAEKIIDRKIKTESNEEFPSFSIVQTTSDQKAQNWMAQYVPAATLKRYRKLFRANKLKLKSITSPINAILDSFKIVREAIFNAHAIYEIIDGYVEAYYISADGILYFERHPYTKEGRSDENLEADGEKALKQLLFKIINTIFRINSNYMAENPQIPLQLAWICGDVGELNEIATALKEAMSVEVAIAPAMPSGMENESAYVPLGGFAASLHNGTAVTYSTADFFRRFPLRKTYGISIFVLTGLLALLAFFLTEREYQTLRKQIDSTQKNGERDSSSRSNPSHLKNMEVLKKLTSKQFVFYPIFRELANDLPKGVFLESVEYKFKDDIGNITITALIPLGERVTTTNIPGQLMSVFDASPYLNNHLEPSISTVFKDKEPFLKIVFNCEVKSIDTTK